jgi:hypothetical protein
MYDQRAQTTQQLDWLILLQKIWVVQEGIKKELYSIFDR